ncbi:MAG: AarF/UbiB family protein [Kofleriaceae bacterium]
MAAGVDATRSRLRRRLSAEVAVGAARLWARARQILTTDPSSAGDDDRIVDEAGERELARHAGELKGGLAKVAQLVAYTGRGAPAALRSLWDEAPAVAAAAIEAVVTEELGRPPRELFASWDPTPLAAASLGQVHAATDHDGRALAVKVQYPGVAEALADDVRADGFVRRLAGLPLGRALSSDALAAIRAAVVGELDYQREADALERAGAAWAGDPVIRIPAVDRPRSSRRVLTMTRAPGVPLTALAADDPRLHGEVAAAMVRFAWGSPLVHGFFNADPNPGNYLIEAGPDLRVWFLDFGCTVELDDALAAADRGIWHGLLDDDAFAGAERFRMALDRSGLLHRASSLATVAHRDWERALAAPFASVAPFRWDRHYAGELATATRDVLAAGGLTVPAPLALLWRQRMGVAAVLGMLEPATSFRRVLIDTIGTGKRALR